MNETQQKPPYAMIAILFVGAFIAFLNNTLLNVALPTIMVEFDVKASVVQWLTTGYMLINGILIPASAYFVTKFSNRKLFITAMTLFSLGTIFGGYCTRVLGPYISSYDSSGRVSSNDAFVNECYVDCIPY